GGGVVGGPEGRDQLNTSASLPPGSPALDDTAPAAGSSPATGAAPFPQVEVLGALPPLGPDDVLAVPVGDDVALPGWLTAPTAPVDAALIAAVLADTGNKGRAGALTDVPIADRRP